MREVTPAMPVSRALAPCSPAGSADGVDAEVAEADGRSVYVGAVDYSATPEELQEHFAACGTVNRVTILCDKFRNPKGFAYIEFAEESAVEVPTSPPARCTQPTAQPSRPHRPVQRTAE